MHSLTWQQLFDNLRPMIALMNKQGVHTHKQAVLDLLSRYRSSENDFKPYLFYDEKGYTKNLVEELSDKCNIIVMCWGPGQSSSFHAHEGSKCFVKILSGELGEQQVSYPTDTVSTENAKFISLTKDDVTYIDDSIGLHRVFNKSPSVPATTLHIYLPAYKICRIFNSTFDNNLLSLKNSKTVDVTFNSRMGSYCE